MRKYYKTLPHVSSGYKIEVITLGYVAPVIYSLQFLSDFQMIIDNVFMTCDLQVLISYDLQPLTNTYDFHSFWSTKVESPSYIRGSVPVTDRTI